jgi:DNA-binding MarR family transcriptional regulator
VADADAIESIDRTRIQWSELGEPKVPQFVALMSLLRAMTLVTGRVDEVLKKEGLSRTGYLIMITLRVSPGQTRPLGQLSKALLVHPTTVTLVIEQLQAAGYVERRDHPTDRRAVLASLTPAGVALVTSASQRLADIDYGLGATDDAAAERLIGELRGVRLRLGDTP